MKRLYLRVRAAFLWIISLLHFGVATLALLLLAVFVHPRKLDWLPRRVARNIVRLAGAKLQVRYAPGFDPQRTSIFVSNHVNVFDPFVLYSSIPQYIRGWELESHFNIPVYGWLMKRYGNIPVADQKNVGNLKKLFRLTQQALAEGTSLVVFAEGGRTLDGHVQAFQPGIFRLVHDLGYPIVPVSIVGSFDFNRKGNWMLYPSTITVHLHDTIETNRLEKRERQALAERVQQTVSGPVEEALARRGAGHFQ
ncbi:MAG: 1-acyl-sn-glycerol-3-phosphate acyltransferase [Acidobacteria bacterium]|nr:1-acyl-sn-glycerol-3-phosphate acyltransferase [Acidobacteriota bacterium]